MKDDARENQASIEAQMVKAMGACLRVILDDIRAQYRHCRYEVGRLERANDITVEILDDLGLKVNQERGESIKRKQA